MLQMILEIQAEGPRTARKKLYELTSGRTKVSLADLYRRRNEVEPALHIINSISLMVDEGMIPEKPIMRDWGGLIARCWCASKGLVLVRRAREGRPDLWKPLENFGEKALLLERSKAHESELAWWTPRLRTRTTLMLLYRLRCQRFGMTRIGRLFTSLPQLLELSTSSCDLCMTG